MTTASPRDRTRSHGIVQELGAAIVTGAYADRPFPVEFELAQQFQASRSVVREAVKMLTAKGLLRARPRQGTWIQAEEFWNLQDPDVLRWMLQRRFSLPLLIEFTEVRLGVEPAAAALAAVSATRTQSARIAEAIERMYAAGRGEDDSLESDIAFHSAVLKATGNRFYAQQCELIETALRFSIRQTNSYKGVSLASIEDHRRVADAIFAGDAAGAEAAMRYLVQEALGLMQSALAPNVEAEPSKSVLPFPSANQTTG
ncbi:FadR/GntR family transcriptional regulator [Brevundimonas sp.]|uniref:FadR/GntR family transcriptional regulator n=1 Tax=Brevundimonas sp. TaxID=1871086 RepID=UPI002737FBA7|nr:FCD domain-containing protein [Brevundimonas sp.]MDP3803585.1 FCD domain-containing protein [Brevundimonas sp.]